jgi:hypothetical protein
MSATRRLGSTQLDVLRTVAEGHDPVDSKEYGYEVRCRRSAIAHKLIRRGLLGLYAYNHPTVIAGACQWYLTAAGSIALAVRS